MAVPQKHLTTVGAKNQKLLDQNWTIKFFSAPMILLQFSVAFIGIFLVQIWDILFQKTQKNAISFKKWWFSKQIKNRGKPRESGAGCRT